MALLSLQSMTAAGLTPATVSAAAGGDTVALAGPSDDRTFLYVVNGAGASMTVTIADPGATPAGNPGTASPVTVAAGATKLIPLPSAAVNPSTGVVSVSYSAVTTVTVAAVRR